MINFWFAATPVFDELLASFDKEYFFNEST